MSENGMTKPHWILIESEWNEEVYQCSECGLLWTLIDGNPLDNEMYYCPKCGAHMSDFIEQPNKELLVS